MFWNNPLTSSDALVRRRRFALAVSEFDLKWITIARLGSESVGFGIEVEYERARSALADFSIICMLLNFSAKNYSEMLALECRLAKAASLSIDAVKELEHTCKKRGLKVSFRFGAICRGVRSVLRSSRGLVPAPGSPTSEIFTPLGERAA